MKTYILLGMLLLAGLSFAYEPPENWMTYTTKNYGCSYNKVYGYYESPNEYTRWDIAGDFEDSECFEYESMYFILQDMWYAMFGHDGMGMCDYAGCFGSEGVSTTSFRASTLYYNSLAAQFNSLYLSGLRYCLVKYPGAYTEVMQDLSYQRQNYLECVSEAGVCYGCFFG